MPRLDQRHQSRLLGPSVRLPGQAPSRSSPINPRTLSRIRLSCVSQLLPRRVPSGALVQHCVSPTDDVVPALRLLHPGHPLMSGRPWAPFVMMSLTPPRQQTLTRSARLSTHSLRRMESDGQASRRPTSETLRGRLPQIFSFTCCQRHLPDSCGVRLLILFDRSCASLPSSPFADPMAPWTFPTPPTRSIALLSFKAVRTHFPSITLLLPAREHPVHWLRQHHVPRPLQREGWSTGGSPWSRPLCPGHPAGHPGSPSCHRGLPPERI